MIAGGEPTTIDLEVIDRADSVSLITAPTSLHSGFRTDLCFQARNGGRYIAGLEWTIAAIGQISRWETSMLNCIVLTPLQTSGNITVNATAAGQSISITLPVVQ